MANIFISYAKEDRSRIEPLAKALAEQGWSVFWDRTIPVGKSWRNVIQSELEAAKCVVVIWTENSINSKWVLAEVNEAYEKDSLTQVLFENITIPFPYKQEQAADLIDWKVESTHSGFTILLSAISEVVGPSPMKEKETEQRRAEEERRRQQEQEQRRKEKQIRESEARHAEEEIKTQTIEKKTSISVIEGLRRLLNVLGIIALIIFLFIFVGWVHTCQREKIKAAKISDIPKSESVIKIKKPATEKNWNITKINLSKVQNSPTNQQK